MKRLVLAALCVGGAFLAATFPALALIDIRVDLDRQRLSFTKPDGESVVWKISSGRPGFETPTGKFNVQRMDADHHSDEYDQAPMPWSIFFYRGLAIHGTNERGLGRPASHGCVRLSVPHAQELYDLVEKHGATIDISGDAAVSGVIAAEDEAPRRRRRSRQPEEPALAPAYGPRPDIQGYSLW